MNPNIFNGEMATSTNSPKLSLLKAKTGFIIPKNKLSGSLVPAFKGVKKPEGSEVVNEESTKQTTQRKTKWGPDLAQDATVRRGRALAYQTRVDHLTQLLESGSLTSGKAKLLTAAVNVPEQEHSSQSTKDKKAQLLELEKQEAIGEILKLNPGYMVPSDYKPITREARVPLPIKEDAGYNFVCLVFGPASDTQKRVEKETGAVMRVYGTKIEGGKKEEVTASDASELLSYNDLHVLVSADSYEKVDAAVVLIELLVASFSGKSAAAAAPSDLRDDLQTVSNSQAAGIDPLNSAAMHNQGSVGSEATSHGSVQPNPSLWHQMGPSSTPGFVHPPNPSLPIVSNSVTVSPYPYYPSNMPSLFAPRSGHVPAFGSAPLNSNFVPPRSQPPLQGSPNTFTPLPHLSGQYNPPNNSAASPFSGHQLPGVPGPVGPSISNSISGFPSGHLPERPITPAGNSGWSGAPMNTSIFMGPHSVPQMAPPVSGTTPSASMVSGLHFPPQQHGPFPGSSTSLPPRPLHGPFSMSSQNQPTASMLVQHFGQVPTSPNHTSLGSPQPLPGPPTVRSMQPGMPGLGPGGIPAPSFTPLRSMGGPAPGVQQTNAGDFTYQPHRPDMFNHPASRPSGQSGPQGAPLLGLQLPPAAPSFRPAMQGVNSQSLIQTPPLRSPMGNQMGLQHPPSHLGNPNQIPPSHMNAHMGPRNHNSFPPPSAGPPFLHQPGNSASFQQGHLAPPFARPGNRFPPNQSFGNNHPMPAGRPQVYDPFSPTSVPQNQGGNLGNVRRQESDPEYDDLMASVGVK